MQQAAIKGIITHNAFGARLQQCAAAIAVMLLCAVPLTFLTIVHRFYTLPRFALLLAGSSILVAVLALLWADSRLGAQLHTGEFKTRQSGLLALYVLWIGLSTIFGVAPVVSLFGSFENQMGLLTHLCFFACFLGLIAGVGRSRARLETVLWAMVLTALAVAVYGVAQFSGIDPFVSPALYTSRADGNRLIRIPSSIGHADYLGNFLLYTVWIAFALALVSSHRARRIALAASSLIATAIICSGTRGAWVGLIVGAITFAFLEGRSAAGNLLTRRKWIPVAITASILVIAFYLLIIASPASRNIVLRAESFVADRLTGSGRTLLWRDSIKMIPAFAIKGCGPEGFRKAFLPYKSRELAQLAPQTNNESSHNAYLDAAISYGLPGLALYVGVIASTFYLLLRAHRRTTRGDFRIIISGLLASYAAVIVHNIFIFDQIPTGLYFFALAAIAQIVSSITNRESENDGDKNSQGPVKSHSSQWPLWATAAIGFVIIGAATWYSVGLMRADVEIKRAFASAETANLEKVMRHGARATLSADPTRAYDFLFAQAIAVCVDRLPPDASAARDNALEVAADHAKKSIARTLAPESNYLLLAYIYRSAGETAELEASAAKALEWDANFANSRWLMAEAYRARGLNKEAAREAKLGLDLNPHSRQLAQTLKEARRAALSKEDLVKRYIKRGDAASDRGNMKKAQRLITTAIRLSDGRCPACHRSLALLYEKANRYDEAISEWNEYIKEDSSTADRETALHLKELIEKKAGSSKTIR